MKLPEIGVKRPVFTAMLFIGVLLMGLVAFFSLPTDVLPDVEMPTLTVITVYPGASANEVEQQVTKPLESMLSGTQDLKKITSKSKENVSFITLQFNWSADLNNASANARDMIEMAKRHLPTDARNPIIMRINSSMMPVLIYGVNAKESYEGLNKIIDDQIVNRIKKIEGVGAVMQIGNPKRQIQVEVQPEKLKAYNLSMSLVTQMIKMSNIAIPGGNINIGVNDYAVKIPGEFTSIQEVEDMPLIMFNRKLIRLGDVATINDGFKEKDERIRYDNKEAVGLLIQKQSGANTLEVAENVKKEMLKIQGELPPDVQLQLMLDSSVLVSSSIKNLTETILFAALFVIIVVLVFLRNARGSFIVIASIPFSLIVAFIFMSIAGYSINIFSLMSLAIAIGMVVDNAIIVLDNITRHIEKGISPKQASIFATGEMGLAISASTFTIMAVFLPLVFMGGIVGIIFRQLALLTAITLLASLIVSLMLTPMMASLMLRPHNIEKNRKHSKLFYWTERQFINLENGYKNWLIWSLKHKTFIIIAAVVLFVSSLFIGKNIGTDYIPEFDAGDIIITLQTPVGTSTVATAEVAKTVEKIIKDNVPELASSFSVVGQTESGVLSSVGFEEGKNCVTIIARLCEPEKRKRSSREITEVLSIKIGELPEIEKYKVSGGSLLSAALLGNSKPIQISLSSSNLDKINQITDIITKEFSGISWLRNVESTIDRGKRELQIKINRQKASNLGLNSGLIGIQVRESIFGTDAGQFKEDGDEYDIVVRYDSAYRNSAESIGNIILTTLTGQKVKLSEVAEINENYGSLIIEHESQQRVVYIKADLNNISLGEANNLAKQRIREMNIPSDISVDFGGQLKDQQESFGSLWMMFIVAIVLVYMIMASQFESFKDPLIIMSAVPLTVIGVIWIFAITGLTLSVVTFVGLIMLIGIDVNQGIILVDYTNLLRKRGHSITDATTEAGRLRLRPVLMTALAALMGMVPMALSTGMGSEIWAPLGITVIGGLIVSKFMTMFLIPVLYVVTNPKARKEEKLIMKAKESKLTIETSEKNQ